MPGSETVKLQVELIEKNAEARLRALDKLAKEMANRKITMQFDEASLAKWKTATEGMTNSQLSNYVKLAIGAENAAAKVVAAETNANAKVEAESKKSGARLVAQAQKSKDNIIKIYEQEDTKRRAIAAQTEREVIKANNKIEVATLKGVKGTRQQTQAHKELNTEAQKTGGIFDSLTKRFTAANLISAAVTRGITLLRTALRQAVDEMKEMDKELTTIKMVTGASDSDIAQLRANAFSGARAAGRTTSDYLTAAERFARAGYRENIQDLTKLSLVTQNVGGVTEDVASKFILAADAAWQLDGNVESLWSLLDGVTAIADQNATDLGKLAEAYTVAGSAFANAGESERTFAALIGTTTAATQRSGSEMARGLQTILFRVRQVKGEIEDGEMINAADISNAAKALDSVGISVLNDSRELKSFSEIMGELNKKWDTLNTKEKAYLQNALAGNRRGNVLFALMDNYDMYMRQLQQFDESSGSAIEKNEVFTNSWQAATNELNTSWTETISLLTDAGGLLQGIVKLTTNVLDFINKYQTWSHEGRAKGYFDNAADWRTTTARNLLSQGVEGFGGGGSGHSFADDAWEAADAQDGLAEATIQVVKVYGEEAEAVNRLAEAFDNAQTSIKNAAEAMKTEKDDSIKSAADIYKAMQTAAGKGYYGSNAYKEGAMLFFGTADKSAISEQAQKALDTYFEAMASGDYSNAAAKLWGRFSDASGNIIDKSGNIIATMKDIGDSYQWAFNKGEQSIDDFLQSMQDSTGVGKDFWASMMQSLGMYSDEMDQWMEENLELPEPELKIGTDSAEDEVQSAVDNINKMLDGIKDKTVRINIIQSINGMSVFAAESYVSSNTSGSVAGIMNSVVNRIKGKAGGKHDGYSGLALVNDEFPANGSKPELIISKSQGRAFIANGGRPALVNLRSDDVVLSNRETKSAFGIPGFWQGKNVDGSDGGGSSGVAIVTTSPKQTSPASSKSKGGSSSAKADPSDIWSTLKKLVDYLLDKGEDDLKEQLKVLDDQLAELEAERKAQQESNELEEKQLAVQNALLDLERAQVERTVRYYNEETQQWEWMADKGSVKKAEEAYEKALQDLNDYLDEQAYEERKAAIKAQKEDLQAQFDEFEDSWKAIVDAIEAPAGDLKKLLSEITKNGTSTMIAQSGGIADLLNSLRAGLVSAGYVFGLGNINANTSGSTTNASTVFDDGGFAFGKGLMRKGVGAETVIGPDITRDILNPVKNARFAAFADSIRYIMDGGNSLSFRNPSTITNNNGGNYYVNGVQVGPQMAQRPFAEVMQTIAIHANEAI